MVMERTALVARDVAAGLCLAALAVLATETGKGWARDPYSNYSQFRYLEAVNMISFMYSVFQFAALVDFMYSVFQFAAAPVTKTVKSATGVANGNGGHI